MAEGHKKIRVRVKLFGHLREIPPQPIVVLEVEAGITVYDLILELIRRHGENLRQAMLDSSGNLHGGIEVILKQEILPARKLREIPLTDDCDLLIVPMIEGG